MQTENSESNSEPKPVIKRVTITIPLEVHLLGKTLAKQDHRDFSGQVAALIEADAKRKKEGEVAA